MLSSKYYRRNYEIKPGVLRAIAAFWVVVFHSAIVFSASSPTSWPKSRNPFNSLIYEGWMAVSLFIVLSGYQLGKVLIDSRIDWRKFFLARVLRIYPLYLIAILLSYTSQRPPLTTIILDFLMVPRLPTQYCCATNFTATVWTVRVEFFMYLLLPLIIPFIRKIGWKVMLLIPIIVFIVGLRVSNSMDYYYWQVPGRLIEFTTGVALASINLSSQKKFRKVKLESPFTFLVGIFSLVLISNVVNKNGGEWRISTWWPAVTVGLSLAFFLIMAGQTPPFFKRFQKLLFPIALISELSYGIYLFHFVVIGFLAPKVVQIMNGHPNAITGAAIGAVVCFPISVLFSWLISPIERFFMGFRPIYWATAKRGM